MKTKNIIITFLSAVLLTYGCEKDFEKTNINPVLATNIEPVYQLVSAEIIGLNILQYEATIVQQAQLLLGGAEEAGNRNSNIDRFANNKFNTLYTNQIKQLVDIIRVTKDNPAQQNVYNMSRIMKAWCFMILVDTYGDVPYTEAGLAYISGITLPKYENQEFIYQDIIKELTEAVNTLDAGKDVVKQEMYFGGDIAKWKKFGNSLLLRAGMRYTKVDEGKALQIVQTATDPARGGVMSSNDDNVVLKCNTTKTNPSNGFINGSVRHNWHIGEPFINFMKDNSDPRMQYIAAIYPNPSSSTNPGTPNTNPEDQIGCPYGYADYNIAEAPGFPGMNGAAYKYSQFNRSTVGRIDSWLYYVTYSQTSLLLAEARLRGYITTGAVKDYYEDGIKAHMTQLDTWATVNAGESPITAEEQSAYLQQQGIAFDESQALKQINEQYWVSCLLIWQEAYANYRRSGYPELKPLNFPGEDPYVSIETGGDGFIHRLPYPLKEWTTNIVNVQEAADRMGGDNMGVRIFWDKKI
ncbi:MAG: SusD/RagB family nutrient-binding outer membrane lipoprotein [Bacteroidales bacterium]|jgi:hypothetical protein|nr:SusD/RagB family nutrient-binding outer membrane lipoprotein [Bacteroidales bacterium]